MNKRLLWNFILLPIGTTVAIAVTALLGLLLSLIPHRNHPDGFLNIGYEFYAFPIGIILLSVVVILWTIRVIKDIKASWQTNKTFVLLNILLILLVYFPLYSFVWKSSVSKYSSYKQRRDIATFEVTCQTISLDNDYLIAHLTTGNEILVFLRGKTNGYSGRRIIINDGSPTGKAEVFLNTLNIYQLKDKRLLNETNFHLDTVSYPQHAFLNIPSYNKKCINSFDEKSKELRLDKSCTGNISDTVKGFNIASTGTSYSYLIDNENNYWFTFSTTDHSFLYVGVTNSDRKKKLYKLKINRTGNDAITASKIKGLTKMGTTIYLFADTEILYFDI